MLKVIAIDPGIAKCGFVIAGIKQKKVFKAEVIRSDFLLNYVRKIYQKEDNIQLIIGNGTGSQKYINELKVFIPNLIIAEEKNSTYLAKQRYFEIFPLRGLSCFFPREIFILNKNLDALAALIILENHYDCKFQISDEVCIKTWLK